MTDVLQAAVFLLFTGKFVQIWPYIVWMWGCRSKRWLLFVCLFSPVAVLLWSHITHFQNTVAASARFLNDSVYNVMLLLRFPATAAIPPSPWLTGETPHYHINLSSISFRPRLFLLCLSLSLSSSLLSSLAARLAGCQLLIYTGNILAMMAGLWVVPNAIQQTGDQVSDRLAGICEEEERWQQPLL